MTNKTTAAVAAFMQRIYPSVPASICQFWGETSVARGAVALDARGVPFIIDESKLGGLPDVARAIREHGALAPVALPPALPPIDPDAPFDAKLERAAAELQRFGHSGFICADYEPGPGGDQNQLAAALLADSDLPTPDESAGDFDDALARTVQQLAAMGIDARAVL